MPLRRSSRIKFKDSTCSTTTSTAVTVSTSTSSITHATYSGNSNNIIPCHSPKSKGGTSNERNGGETPPALKDEAPETEEKLTALQKAKLENNRQKALLLRRTKQALEEQEEVTKKKFKQTVPVAVDTGAGFFLEEDEEVEDDDIDFSKLIDNEPFVIEGDGNEVKCQDCSRQFSVSQLRTKFNATVCDECRDDEKYNLITKTTAKTKYLLKDSDLDVREPPLKFITKKNPRNNHWGEMKLYMEIQVYKRAMEVWGSMEAIDEEATKRKILSAKSKAKKFEKKMKELKMQVRSSLYKRELSGHKHEFGEESYDEENDEYSKECLTCGHRLTYEKM